MHFPSPPCQWVSKFSINWYRELVLFEFFFKFLLDRFMPLLFVSSLEFQRENWRRPILWKHFYRTIYLFCDTYSLNHQIVELFQEEASLSQLTSIEKERAVSEYICNAKAYRKAWKQASLAHSNTVWIEVIESLLGEELYPIKQVLKLLRWS